MKQSVLITGAAGFVGRYVAKEFAKIGYSVKGIGWGKFPEYPNWGLGSWNECEVSMESLVDFADEPDVIVHCAGGSSVSCSIEHPRQDFSLTVNTTSQVLEYVRCHSVKTKLVYPSTAAVYGDVESVPIQENATLKPISPYGVHKLMAEDLCRLYASQFGQRIAIVRLFSVYGEGLRKQLLWEACCKLRTGERKFFGTGEEIRDWLYVTDAASLLAIAGCHATSECPVVNGGSGIGIAVGEILGKLSSALDLNFGPTFTSKSRVGDPSALVADTEKARAWGWTPGTDWERGVTQYASWFRNHSEKQLTL